MNLKLSILCARPGEFPPTMLDYCQPAPVYVCPRTGYYYIAGVVESESWVAEYQAIGISSANRWSSPKPSLKEAVDGLQFVGWCAGMTSDE